MSTKTNFKRIALVAVAALGMGVLSSAPSQAVFSGAAGSQVTITVANGTAGQTGAKSDSTTAGTIAVSALALATTDSLVVQIAGKSKPALDTNASYPQVNLMLADTATSTSKTAITKQAAGTFGTWATGLVTQPYQVTDTAVAMGLSPELGQSNVYVAAKFLAYIDSASSTRVAGTYTYTVIVTPYNGTTAVVGGAQTVDISFVVAATTAQSTTVDSTKSTAFIAAAAPATADEAISALATASSTPAAYLTVRTYNSTGTVAAAESITVSIAGAGQIFHAGTSVGGQSITVKSTGSDGDFQVRPDGRAGTATISVSTPTRTFSAKTVNFYAAAAKTITATVATPLLALNANAGAVRATAVDANNIAWTGTAYIVASSAADALVAGSTTPVSCGTYDAVNARFNCPITAIAAGTAKFKIIDAATVALATATSNEVTVTVSTAIAASVKLEFDKATYAPNERAIVYVTPLDSTGKAMQSATYTNLLASGGITVVGTLTYTGTTTTADSFTATSYTTAAQTSATSGAKAGSMQYAVYMPAAGGKITLSATGGTSLPLAAQVAVTASASVTDSGAQALAAVNALATTVASLRTLITTLTNLVLKIQKKVKA